MCDVLNECLLTTLASEIPNTGLLGKNNINNTRRTTEVDVHLGVVAVLCLPAPAYAQHVTAATLLIDFPEPKSSLGKPGLKEGGGQQHVYQTTQ